MDDLGENPLFSETSLFEAPDRCMQLSKPIGRGVEGSPQPRPRPRPPRPRQGAPWEAQLRSTSGLLKQNKVFKWMFCHNLWIFQKQILVSTSTRRFGHFGLLFLMIFWALWEAHFFIQSLWKLQHDWKTVNHLETQLASVFSHFPLSGLNPWDLRSNLCQTGGLNGENCSRQTEGYMRRPKRHQAGTKAGTPNRNLKNLKLKQAWRPEPACSWIWWWWWWWWRFPRPGLRCHKLCHPQCHLWGETHSEGKAMNCFYDTASSN